VKTKNLWQLLLVLVMCFASAAAQAEKQAMPVRFGITPTIVHDRYALLENWREYLQKKLGRPVKFVLRDSYRETIDLLKNKELDFAWLSDAPFVYSETHNYVRLLATPVYQGRPRYCAYLIVPASDTQTTGLLQLKGKIFAYADPYSFTGYLLPLHQLQQSGEHPAHFFRKTFYTWAHQHTIVAVAKGVADGGEVESFVWDTMAIVRPDLTSQTRIVAKSPEYGFPPIAAQSSLSQADFAAMQRVLLQMSNDAEGIELLKELNIDGFISGDPKLYDGARKLMRDMGAI
jgi:phosphonate transport system substrate-binding protein